MNKSVQRVLNQLLRAAGMGRLPVAPPETTRRRLQVIRRSRAHGEELIGELTCEDGEFVFRYVLGYDGPPIHAFPGTDRPYRSRVLWPFFAVRIPPAGRPDVQEAMKGINADDPLEMLATLGHLSVANAYELRLAGEDSGGS